MITLHTFGPAFNLPDPSPFVAKALMLLKLSGLDFKEEIADVTKAPKKKLPYIDDNGTVVADSTFIRRHLEQKHGIDFSGGYDEAALSVGWAVEKMLEEHLYWLIVYTRWEVDENFDKGPRAFFDKAPAPIRPLIVWMVRRGIHKTLFLQGLGRHNERDMTFLARKDFAAVSAILGERPYLLGDKICGFDASLFSFLESALCPTFNHPICDTEKEFPNLQAYCGRMRKEFL